MSSELCTSIGPLDWQREMDLGSDPELVVLSPYTVPGSNYTTGSVRGVPLNRYTKSNNINYGYTTAFRIPLNLTVGTGLTFQIYLTDDGQNAADLGKVVYIGIKGKYMSANATNTVDAGATAGTEQFASCTLSSTANGLSITALAITSANLGNIVAGGMVLIRLRRLATNAADTCLGRPILLRVEVQNT